MTLRPLAAPSSQHSLARNHHCCCCCCCLQASGDCCTTCCCLRCALCCAPPSLSSDGGSYSPPGLTACTLCLFASPHCSMPRYIFIGQGYEYYVGAAGIDAFEVREYALTHVDSLLEDLTNIADWLGFEPPPGSLPHEKGVYEAKNDTYLSTRARANLAQILAHEYELLARIETHATINARTSSASPPHQALSLANIVSSVDRPYCPAAFTCSASATSAPPITCNAHTSACPSSCCPCMEACTDPVWPGMLPQWVMAQRSFGIRAVATAASNATIVSLMGSRLKTGVYHAIKPKAQHDICTASFHGVQLVYLQNYKVNTQGICANLFDMDDQRPTLHGQVGFTFVREPLGRFSSGFSEISWRNIRDRKLPEHGCSNYRRHAGNTTARALAFVEDMAGGTLGEKVGAACSFIDEDLHVVPQVGFIYNALTESWLDAAGKRLTFVGRLESMEEHWEALGRLVLSKVGGHGKGVTWPAYRSDLWAVPWFPHRRSNPHDATNSASANEDRRDMEGLIGIGKDSLSAEKPEAQLALCRIYLPDYVCFGYDLPEACATVIGNQHGISCPWPWMPAALNAADSPEGVIPITDDSSSDLLLASSTCAAYC